MAAIFGAGLEYTNVELLRAKEMVMTVSNNGTIDTITTSPDGTPNPHTTYLIQNVSINFQRPVQILREIGTANGYYNTQPPVGNISIGRVIGKVRLAQLFGAVDKGAWSINTSGSIIIKLSPTSTSTGYSVYTCKACTIANFNISMDANRSLVQDGIQIRFGALDISKTGGV